MPEAEQVDTLKDGSTAPHAVVITTWLRLCQLYRQATEELSLDGLLSFYELTHAARDKDYAVFSEAQCRWLAGEGLITGYDADRRVQMHDSTRAVYRNALDIAPDGMNVELVNPLPA